MDRVEIQDGIGCTISVSKNLRGVISHAGKHGKPQVIIRPERGGSAHLSMHWNDGTFAGTSFASEQVCREFCKKRGWHELNQGDNHETN